MQPCCWSGQMRELKLEAMQNCHGPGVGAGVFRDLGKLGVPLASCGAWAKLLVAGTDGLLDETWLCSDRIREAAPDVLKSLVKHPTALLRGRGSRLPDLASTLTASPPPAGIDGPLLQQVSQSCPDQCQSACSPWDQPADADPAIADLAELESRDSFMRTPSHGEFGATTRRALSSLVHPRDTRLESARTLARQRTDLRRLSQANLLPGVLYVLKNRRMSTQGPSLVVAAGPERASPPQNAYQMSSE
ncbi:uncharacterized protein B0I36DRAFT_348064 [Microdochium trichocladiopsis]|uniref:Uncharacterized protein n=1 Tax=Microdochium trichocladiopsis TaxID=1682393 RepID=A0A9P9BRN4_9PEZI|nr:uncharacterized protein B0I36DRAFT_348064 [Microdochium trichocladiopsis]KAH7032923.1 hypothetical protein B0I36DRAFT_348064 [Microdochium trichocladiopsis]